MKICYRTLATIALIAFVATSGHAQTAKELKEESVVTLRGLTASGQLAKSIDRAATSIERSLVRSGVDLFVSGDEVLPPPDGLHVFQSERTAAQWIERAIEDAAGDSNMVAVLTSVGDNLVEADRRISLESLTAVQLLIDEMLIPPPNAEQTIQEGWSLYAQAGQIADISDAVRAYQDAWLKSYEAIDAVNAQDNWEWARKLYDPDLADELQPTAIGRNGDKENASVEGDAFPELGAIDTEQWSGDNMGGSRSWAGNTLVAPTSRNYFVSMDYWDIREGGEMADGSWKYFPRMMQDGQLRFGYLESGAAGLAVTHGTDFGLDGALPYDSIMVCLPFRIWIGSGSTVWQDGWYAGNPVGAGVWQVQAGDTIRDAQKAISNRIGKLTFLKDVTPEHTPAFKFQVGEAGAWELLTDIDRDGEVDIDTTSNMSGNRPSDYITVSQESGLWITTGAAGGMRSGRVGRTPITISYEEDEKEAVPETPRNRRPLQVTIPDWTYVSPCIIEGKRWSTDYQVFYMASTGTETQEVDYLGSRSFMSVVPLSSTGLTSVLYAQNCYPEAIVSGDVEWRALDLSNLDSAADLLSLKEGESILLTVSGVGTQVAIDTDGDGVADLTGAPGDVFEVTYSADGSYEVVATIDGSEAGSLMIDVVDVTLPKRIVARVGQPRDVEIGLSVGADSNMFTVVAADPNIMDIMPKPTMSGKMIVRVKVKYRGTPVLEVRSVPGNTLLASKEVEEFTVENHASGEVIFDADTGIGTTRMVIRPYLESIGLKLKTFASQSTFAGGVMDLRLDNEENDDIKRVWDEATGEHIGVALFDIEMPPWETMYCFSVNLYPGTSPVDWGDPKPVTCPSVNGGPKLYQVKTAYVCKSKYADFKQSFKFIKFENSECEKHYPEVVDNNGATIMGYVDPDPDPNEPPDPSGCASVSCKEKDTTWSFFFNIPGAQGQEPDLGVYDVKIEDTTFDDKVFVVSIDIHNPIDSDSDGKIDDPATQGAQGNDLTGNEFTYSVDTPGELTVPVRVKLLPNIAEVRDALQGRMRIRIDAIDDSHTTPAGGNVQLSWDNAFPGEATAGKGVYDATAGQIWETTATFTTLPPDNDDFGKKTLTVELLNPDDAVVCKKEVDIEVFWPLLKVPENAQWDWDNSNFARNHPGPDLNATRADFGWTVSRDAYRAPNWFYYWLQVAPASWKTGIERYGDYLVSEGRGQAPAGAYYKYDYSGPIGKVILFQWASQGDSDPDGSGPREATSGIDTFCDVLLHERYHVYEQYMKWCKEGLGKNVTINTLVSSTTWSTLLNRGETSTAGRNFNHDVDLNGDGDTDDSVIESAIVTGAGGPRDVNGDGDQLDSIAEKLDNDEDDVPFWDDPDDADGEQNDLEKNATANENDEEHKWARFDWGHPGKNHKTDDVYDD